MRGFAAPVRRRRLERACCDLTSSDAARQGIADIGDRYGFEADAAFSRAFGLGPPLQHWLRRLGTST